MYVKQNTRSCSSVGDKASTSRLLSLLAALLGKQHGVDVGQDASLGDRHAGQQLAQLLVVADGQLDVAGNDTSLLVVTGGVASQLKDFSGQVLQHGGQVHGGASTDALCETRTNIRTVRCSQRNMRPLRKYCRTGQRSCAAAKGSAGIEAPCLRTGANKGSLSSIKHKGTEAPQRRLRPPAPTAIAKMAIEPRQNSPA